MPTVLITGSNRGLGLEFARQYAADGWRVIATCREPHRADALRAIRPAVEIFALDVTNLADVAALGRTLGHETIDVLLANAGIYIARAMTADHVEAEPWLQTFMVNAIAPLACAGAFLSQVARSRERKMVAISSVAGSVSHLISGGIYAYRSSKAALNATWRAFALDHPEVIATLVSPSRVRTDMNPDAPLIPEASVRSLRGVIAGLTQKDSGQFFRYDGQLAPF
jgi:NAD(P)-dependent dehydrogenase (short-subunit alcohol dehydrogenase family)